MFPSLSYYFFGRQKLSERAGMMIEKYNVPNLIDNHAHVLPINIQSGGIMAYIKTKILLHATNLTSSDANVDYLYKLKNILPGKAVLLAFDKWYDEDGQINIKKTTFYITNRYVINHLYIDHNFQFGCSVHPYRLDALQELRRCKGAGAVLCKWLPNSMGIDPANPLCFPFYELLIQLKMPLLTHTGAEYSTSIGYTDNKLGYVSKLRMALNMGVTIIAAHASSAGSESEFNLFCEMYNKYPNLYADISSVTLIPRVPRLSKILRLNPDKLLYGSDYPLPAVFQYTSLYQLWFYNHIFFTDIPILREIYYYNPLVFDYILKRYVGFDKAIFSRSAKTLIK